MTLRNYRLFSLNCLLVFTVTNKFDNNLAHGVFPALCHIILFHM